MKWLQAEIASGFQRLVSLRLKNTPAEEVLVCTVGVWLEVLIDTGINWNESQDKARIIAAFRLLCRECDSWPSIKTFLEVLPARAPPLELPAPPACSPEVARANIAKIKTMLKTKPILKRW